MENKEKDETPLWFKICIVTYLVFIPAALVHILYSVWHIEYLVGKNGEIIIPCDVFNSIHDTTVSHVDITLTGDCRK